MTPLQQFLLGSSSGAAAENSSHLDTDIKIKEAVQHIFDNPRLIEAVGSGFGKILKAKIEKTDDLDFLRTAFLNYPEHASWLATAADILNKNELLTADNREILLKNPEHAYALANAMTFLKTAHFEMSHRSSLHDTLLQSPANAMVLARGIAILKKATILSEDNQQKLLLFPAYADQIAGGLGVLALSGIFEEDNLKILYKHPQHAKELAHGLALLDEFKILTDDNRRILLKHPKHAPKIAEAVGILGKRNLLTEANLNSILQSPIHSRKLARAIAILKINEILTEDYIEILLHDPEHSEKLAKGLGLLAEVNLLTEPTRRIILQCPAHAERMAVALKILINNDLFDQINVNELLEEPHRAIDIANEIVREVPENEFVDLYVTGENTHNRDGKIRIAIEDLRKSQGSITSKTHLFKNFLLRQEPSPKIEAALYAMEGAPKPGEDFPALIGLQDPWAIEGLEIVGEELLSRLWLFTTQIEDAQNRENAQLSMISALADSFDDHGFRVCNPGKAVRLVTGVLQGNVPGLIFDEVDNPTDISPAPAVGMFFLLPEHQEIGNRDELRARAEAWLEENPLVTDRDGFRALLEEYADYQELA